MWVHLIDSILARRSQTPRQNARKVASDNSGAVEPAVQKGGESLRGLADRRPVRTSGLSRPFLSLAAGRSSRNASAGRLTGEDQ